MENLPSEYDVVKLNAHWRCGWQLICQGDCYLNLFSIPCLAMEYSLLKTRLDIAAQQRKTSGQNQTFWLVAPIPIPVSEMLLIMTKMHASTCIRVYALTQYLKLKKRDLATLQ